MNSVGTLAKWYKKYQQIAISTGITVVTALVMLGIRQLGGMVQIELLTYDLLLRLRPPQPIDDRIVIVEINESDIQRVGKWPWSDALFAKLIQRIDRYQPAVIAVDKYLDIPVIDRSRQELVAQVRGLLQGKIDNQLLTQVLQIIPDRGREELVAVIRQANKVVNVFLVPISPAEQGVPTAPDLESISLYGFANLVTDSGSIVRRALIAGQYGSFALETANLYLTRVHQRQIEFHPETETFRAGHRIIPRLNNSSGGYHHEDASGYQILINYRGKDNSFLRVSSADLLTGKSIPPDVLKGKIVLIGATAVSIKDSFPTPFSTGESVMYGVEIHAHIISQLVSATLDDRPFMETWSDHWEVVWIMVWTILGGTIAMVGKGLWWNLCLRASAISAVVSITYGCFLQSLWIPLFPALAGLLLADFAVVTYRLAVQESERKLLMGLFSSHVSKELVEVIWESRDQFLQEGRIRGQEMFVTVLFTDMRNFSTAAEAQKPGETLNWLNTYLSTIAEAVIAHGGMVDKYIGDAVMAVFGVPVPHLTEAERNQDAENAVKAAIAIAQRLEALNKQWYEQELPEVTTGIGVNSGIVIAGSLGSADRLEYSVIGDAVNIAARLESFNKEVDGGEYHILISEETKRRLPDKYVTEFVGSYALKGKTEVTSIYRVPPQPLTLDNPLPLW
jgi:adenylate cyclase